MGQKRLKFENLAGSPLNGALNGSVFRSALLDADSPPPSRSPPPAAAKACLSSSTTHSNTSSSSGLGPQSVLSSLFAPAPAPEDLGQAMAAAAAAYLQQPAEDSPNALFGRLVANELDKLPPGMHNIVRAQVLLLLAQCAQQSPNSAQSVSDRILSCLSP